MSVLACLLALPGALAQDPSPETRLTALLDELARKSERYEHFSARYRVLSKADEAGEARLVFAAPDRARFSLEGAQAGTEMYILGSRLVMRTRVAGGPARGAAIDNFNAEGSDRALVHEQLERAFPGKLQADEFPESEELSFSFDIDADCGNIGFSVVWGGSQRLRWLRLLREDPSKLALTAGEPQQLIYSPCADVRVLVSAETGFVARVERQKPEGVRVGLELVELDLEHAPEAKDLEPPPAEAGTQDLSADVEADFARRGLEVGRMALFHALARLLDDGRIEWSERVPQAAEATLRALAEHECQALYHPARTRQEAWLTELEGRVQEALAQPGANEPANIAALRQQAAKSRAGAVEGTKKQLEQLFQTPYPSGKCKSRPTLGEDLGVLERRVFPALYEEQIVKPLLAAFDERIGKPLAEK